MKLLADRILSLKGPQPANKLLSTTTSRFLSVLGQLQVDRPDANITEWENFQAQLFPSNSVGHTAKACQRSYLPASTFPSPPLKLATACHSRNPEVGKPKSCAARALCLVTLGSLKNSSSGLHYYISQERAFRATRFSGWLTLVASEIENNRSFLLLLLSLRLAPRLKSRRMFSLCSLVFEKLTGLSLTGTCNRLSQPAELWQQVLWPTTRFITSSARRNRLQRAGQQ